MTLSPHISTATCFLNNIFYKKTGYGPSTVCLLQKFMLSDERKKTLLLPAPLVPVAAAKPLPIPIVLLDSPTPTPVVPEVTISPSSYTAPPPSYSPQVYFPSSTSHLFWCLYIRKYEYSQYVYLKNTPNVEMEERQRILDYFRSNKNQLKETNHKITHAGVQEILSELMTSPKITPLLLIAFSVYYKMKIYVVKKNLYVLYDPFYHVSVDDVDTAILHCNDKEHYGIDLETSSYSVKIEEIKRQKHAMENMQKPLKGISSYKVSDLYDIAYKLGMFLSSDTKITKQELYNKILETCLSMGWK